jgi:two-component system response regulator NreC
MAVVADDEGTALERARDPIRIVLVDDHALVRKALVRVLAADPGLVVVGEASDGRGAITEAARLQPDVVVLDIGLPGLNGIDVTSRIVKSVPGVHVLMLSMHAGATYVREALKAGAKGYLVKECADVELIQAVHAVADDAAYFSPAIARLLAGEADTDRGPADGIWRLTGREREVLQLIAEGKTTRQVAEMLGISADTIESHRKHVMEKLGLHSTAEMVRFAVQSGVML